MATIAYVGLPAHGHTNPSLPVMKELLRRGHQVRHYNGGAFRAKVAPTGVEFRALPEPLPTEREIAEALHNFINASVMLSGISRPLARFLVDEFDREPPDLVIYDSAAMWGFVAARTHAIPNVCFITTFVLDGSMRAIGLGTMLRFLWTALPHIPKLMNWRRSMAREFGKANAGGLTEYAGLNIVFTSSEFHPPNSFVDERFCFAGPSIDPATRDGDFPFDRLQDGPKVYISLGTINNLDTAFYRAAFDAFADHPAQFILSIGKHTDPSTLGPAPDNFLVRNYVPQLEILSRVDAFITHGGMNSVHEGLYYGVPEIVVPHQVEQLLNGKRVAQVGAGILLGARYPYGRVRATDLRTALDTLLTTPSYRTHAAAIGATLRHSGGYVAAADAIERHLDTPPT